MASNLLEVNPGLRTCLGIFEILRRLGFPSEHIFFVVVDDGRAAAVAVIEYGIEYAVLGTRWTPEDGDLDAGWAEASQLWNTVDDAQHEELWTSFLQLNQGVVPRLVTELSRVGLYPRPVA
jgi:hypothetical protein